MRVTPPSSSEEEAALALLRAAYTIGAERQVCPVCMILNLAKAMDDLLAVGEIHHGVPERDIDLSEI